MHIDSIHNGKKPFDCNVCSKIFTHKSNLNKHIKIVHEGKKPYACSICSSAFATKQSLKKHIDGVHEGKKPFAYLHVLFVLQHFLQKDL